MSTKGLTAIKSRYTTRAIDQYRWARCLNRFDGKYLMYVYRGLTIGAVVGAVLGLAGAIWLVFQFSFEPTVVALIIFAALITGAIFGQRLVAAILHNILNGMLERSVVKDLGDSSNDSTFTSRAADADLVALGFQKEASPPELSDLLDVLFNQIILGGLVRRYRLTLNDGRIYLVTVGYDNEEMVYQRGADGLGSRLPIWRLSVQGELPLEVHSLARNPSDVVVKINDIPSYNEKDVSNKLSGWVTTNYTIIIKLEIEKDNLTPVLQTPGVLETIRERARAVGRLWLAYVPYNLATTEDFAKEFQKRLVADNDVKATGLTVKNVFIPHQEGSQELSKAMQKAFDNWRILEDRKQAALSFGELDSEIFTRMLQAEACAKGIDLEVAREQSRFRASDQIFKALIENGEKPVEVLKRLGTTSRYLSQPGANANNRSLSGEAAARAFEEIEQEVKDGKTEWPKQDISAASHQERLEKERAYLKQHAAVHMLWDEREWERNPAVFEFGFPNVDDPQDTLKIEWYNPGPPVILWNGTIDTNKYPRLGERVYDYNDVTIFALYRAARVEHGI